MSSILPAMALSNGNVLDCEAEEAPPISSNGPGAVERPSYTMLHYVTPTYSFLSHERYGMIWLCYTNDMDRFVFSGSNMIEYDVFRGQCFCLILQP